jgi:hypothetical protein
MLAAYRVGKALFRIKFEIAAAAIRSEIARRAQPVQDERQHQPA